MTTEQTSSVNKNIADAVSDVQEFVVGQGASQSMSMMDMVLLETLGMSMHNAVSAQQKMQMVSAAAVTATCARIISAVPTPPPPSKDKKKDRDLETGGDSTQKSPDPLAKKISKDSGKATDAVGTLVNDLKNAENDEQTAKQNLQSVEKQVQDALGKKKSDPDSKATDDE